MTDPRLTLSVRKTVVAYLLGAIAGATLTAGIILTAIAAFRTASCLVFLGVFFLLGFGVSAYLLSLD
jgi:hypothetical protein